MKRFNQYVKALRWALAIVMCVVCSGTAWANFGGTNYYFKANAYVTPTGGGKVYISNNRNATPEYVDKFESTSTNNGGSRDITLYYFAQANPGFQFKHWAKTATGTSEGTANPQDFALQIGTNSTSSNNATVFTYYAVFDELTGVVQVQLGSGEGNANINKADNKIGDAVTLTATSSNDEDYAFEGWSKNNQNGTIISKENPYSFTITSDNVGTYYAHFKKLDKSFVRLQNVSTGKFLSLYGNAAATAHNYNNESGNPDGFSFNGSLKMISETDAQGNPMTVFMRMGTSGTDFTEGNLKAAGVAYNTLINSASYPLTMHQKENGNYVVYTTHNVKTKKFYITFMQTSYGNTTKYYLGTNGYFSKTDNVEWEIDEEGYISSGGRYITYNNKAEITSSRTKPTSPYYQFAIDADDNIYLKNDPDYFIKFRNNNSHTGYVTSTSTAGYSKATHEETNNYSNQPSARYSFLFDEGSDSPVMKTLVTKTSSKYKDPESAPKEAEWRIYELKDEETTGAFGANTKAKFTDGKGKYYTTMFSYFPYQLGSGVKAYYLPLSDGSYDEEKNTVTFTEITGNVPANTAVVLECDAVQNANGEVDNVKNILTPLTGTVEALPNGNLLKGYTSLNGSTVSNDKEKMYVLSVNSNGKLGFYHSNNANMSANKAYLEMIDIVEQTYPQAKNASFSFGDIDDEEEGTVTGITVATENNSTDAPIYDLSGRKVENPGRGIYIRNNKKFVVK